MQDINGCMGLEEFFKDKGTKIIHSKELALPLEMLSKQEENYNNDYILFMLYIIIFTQIIFYLLFIFL